MSYAKTSRGYSTPRDDQPVDLANDLLQLAVDIDSDVGKVADSVPSPLGGVKAMQVGIYEAASMDGGKWVNPAVTFPKAFPSGSSVMVFISPINASNCECSIGLTAVTTTGFKAVVVNNAPRATGAQYLKWLAVAM